MNKKQFFERYKKSTHKSIYECYKKPSFTKEIAEHYIFDEMHNRGGEGYKVLSYNQNFFTAAYIILPTCKEENAILVVYTPFRTLEIKL